MRIREVACRHALVLSALPGLDYALNPYRGCAHGCAYCYAPHVLHETRAWGTFVDVRIDIPTILTKDLRRKCDGVVGIGTVTDPYQPMEVKYRITRESLLKLMESPLHVSIQTKSSLILRDLDILTKLERLDVGVTITTLDRYIARALEPLASQPIKRLEAISALSEVGIDAWAFVGPYLPGLQGEELEKLVTELHAAGATKIIGDKLRIRPGTIERIKKASLQMLPEERMAFIAEIEKGSYSAQMDEKLRYYCTKIGIKFEPAFQQRNYIDK